MLRSVVVCLTGVSLLIAIAGCGSSPTSPSSTTVNLAGNWTGTISTNRATWTATQNGASVTGPMALITQGGVPLSGLTLSGTISGTQVALTLTAPAGTYTPFGPSSSACSATGTGSSTASATSISAVINLTYTAPCVGNVSSALTGTAQLTLTKS